MRTQVVKKCVSLNLPVARFLEMAKRTRLNKRSFKDSKKIAMHVAMWSKYGWI